MKKKVLLILLAVMVVGIMVCAILGSVKSSRTRARIEEHATMAEEYCRKQKMSTDWCFLVDFDIHSGKNRFFVWDFNEKKVIYSTICVHGCGKESTRSYPVISDEPGSKCSSTGRFMVGRYRKMHNHPIHCFELTGLDPSCKNARTRAILIHPTISLQIPTYPIPMISFTAGCFGMSLRGMEKIKYFTEQTDAPVLLWAYK